MDGLRERLLDWIRAGGGFTSFDEAALALFARQFETNTPYRRYAEARGLTPAAVSRWQEIPAAPTDAFKFPRLPLRSFDAADTVKTFRTSGTTRDVRGEHHFDDLRFYETSVLEGWKQARIPIPENPWFLSQSIDDSRDSSLVHMFETLRFAHAPQASDRWLIDAAGAIDADRLERAAAAGKPVALFATAIGLIRFIERFPALPLPADSWIFETGGYKGLTVELDPAEFRARVAKHFSVPVGSLLNEYGMTELSSPFYAWSGETAHRGSPWTRIRVIDPETGEVRHDDQPGYLEILDLANFGSVAAIRTQDLAIARGENSFTLLGRDPGALPRGCSRRADDLLNAPR